MRGSVVEIPYKTAVDFLLPRHYSGRSPQISKAFGLYADGNLKAVCTFGKPASPALCVGVCGKQYASNVYELNRLCRTDDWTEPLSQFVSTCLRKLKVEDWIVVSYSDTAMQHHGYIYQACNFIYTGCTKQRTDKWTATGKHSRHYNNDDQGEYRKVRTAKHRYIYFCTSKRLLKREWRQALNYPVQEYPKGDNAEDYILGEYLKETLVKIE